jgi:uncharacterized membrane protein YedE/YeeE
MPALDSLFPLGISHYLAGGLIIGFAVSFLFVSTGLIGGMSTLFSSSLSFISEHPYFQQDRFVSSRNWRLVYALGLVIGALIWWVSADFQSIQTGLTWWQLAIGGFIAGFGARLSNGCTSGHGICGLASLQLPSLLSVIIFLASAMVSAALVQLVGGA